MSTEDKVFAAVEAGVPKFQGDMPCFVKETQEYWDQFLDEYTRGRGYLNPGPTADYLLRCAIAFIGEVDSHEDIGKLVRTLTVLKHTLDRCKIQSKYTWTQTQ